MAVQGGLKGRGLRGGGEWEIGAGGGPLLSWSRREPVVQLERRATLGRRDRNRRHACRRALAQGLEERSERATLRVLEDAEHLGEVGWVGSGVG